MLECWTANVAETRWFLSIDEKDRPLTSIVSVKMLAGLASRMKHSGHIDRRKSNGSLSVGGRRARPGRCQRLGDRLVGEPARYVSLRGERAGIPAPWIGCDIFKELA